MLESLAPEQRRDGHAKQHIQVGGDRLNDIEKIVARLKEVVRNTEATMYRQQGETSKDQQQLKQTF